jgi:hypothetical protein
LNEVKLAFIKCRKIKKNNKGRIIGKNGGGGKAHKVADPKNIEVYLL